MKVLPLRRSSLERSKGSIIFGPPAKQRRDDPCHMFHDQTSGGMGLVPHLVCKTRVKAKDLPAEKRPVATHKVPWWVRFLLSLSIYI
ncbi:MAG TPA: hypothetical protein VK448_06665, partial [Dissulfurispiraceae bacterium]|nr:hypothetical protein [Dissulfurispiraceae bacterium]